MVDISRTSSWGLCYVFFEATYQWGGPILYRWGMIFCEIRTSKKIDQIIYHQKDDHKSTVSIAMSSA